MCVMWRWRRLLRVPWLESRINVSILQELGVQQRLLTLKLFGHKSLYNSSSSILYLETTNKLLTFQLKSVKYEIIIQHQMKTVVVSIKQYYSLYFTDFIIFLVQGLRKALMIRDLRLLSASQVNKIHLHNISLNIWLYSAVNLFSLAQFVLFEVILSFVWLLKKICNTDLSI